MLNVPDTVFALLSTSVITFRMTLDKFYGQQNYFRYVYRLRICSNSEESNECLAITKRYPFPFIFSTVQNNDSPQEINTNSIKKFFLNLLIFFRFVSLSVYLKLKFSMLSAITQQSKKLNFVKIEIISCRKLNAYTNFPYRSSSHYKIPCYFHLLLVFQ